MRLIDADALMDKTDDRYSLGEIGRRERDDIIDALILVLSFFCFGFNTYHLYHSNDLHLLR